MKRKVQVASRKEWRAWLRTHHAREDEVWLVYFKKHTQKPTVTYRESLEEALCFGWIDGIKRRIDDERYMHRFTPRRPKSRWSALNIRLATELIEQGKMTKPGLAAFERRLEYGEPAAAAPPRVPTSLSPELTAALKHHKRAWKHFNQLAPSHRKQYVGWLMTAKRPETRERRLAETIRLLAANKKLGMK